MSENITQLLDEKIGAVSVAPPGSTIIIALKEAVTDETYYHIVEGLRRWALQNHQKVLILDNKFEITVQHGDAPIGAGS